MEISLRNIGSQTLQAVVNRYNKSCAATPEARVAVLGIIALVGAAIVAMTYVSLRHKKVRFEGNFSDVSLFRRSDIQSVDFNNKQRMDVSGQNVEKPIDLKAPEVASGSSAPINANQIDDGSADKKSLSLLAEFYSISSDQAEAALDHLRGISCVPLQNGLLQFNRGKRQVILVIGPLSFR